MAIVGFNFTKINVERTGKLDPKDKIANSINLLEIQEEKLPFSEGKGLLKLDFQFDITYGKVGKMSLNGVVLLMDEPNKTKEILESWNKDRKLEQKVSTEVFNTILFKCNIKALQLADDLNLPAHFRIPLIRIKTEETSKKE
ncbi:hypothetical protein J4440_02270 [Candidatus Woesearchaeota archaeon]|nr:hypothetical protein [Candidatus Woesearchaeota archaeon]